MPLKSFARRLLLSTLALQAPLLHADIITDGTLGDKVRFNGQIMTIGELLGMIKGGNLFHSFLVFDVKTGQQVIFTGADFIKNVIVRVTGDDVSNIDGNITSKVGHANFFLINPSGIVFGKGATVNVPAGFHISTADEIRLADGGVFSATHPKTSILTSGAPESFGFLGGNHATLKIDGAQLRFSPGQNVSFTAQNLVIENKALIQTSGGEIRLRAVGDGKADVGIHDNVGAKLQDGKYTGTMRIEDSTISTDGNGGGRIIAQAGNLNLSHDATLSAHNNGVTDSKTSQGIRIGVTETLNIIDGGTIRTSTNSLGNSGSIKVSANKVNIDGKGQDKDTGIISETKCTGENCGSAGDITVNAQDSVKVINLGKIGSFTSGSGDGNAGDVRVSAADITIDGKNEQVKDKNTGIFSDANCSGSACSDKAGNAGNVTVIAKNNLNLLNNASISSATYGKGDAGNIAIHVGNALNLVDGGLINSSTHAGGDAGNISISAGDVNIRGHDDSTASNISSYSTAEDCSETGGCNGDAGNISLNVKGSLNMVGAAKISTETKTDGNAGQIAVNAGNVNIDGKGNAYGIYSSSDCFDGSCTGGGNAGDIKLNIKGTLNIVNAGSISTSTITQGDAGTITVNAGNIQINGNGQSTGIYSNSGCADDSCTGGGNAGTITVNAENSLQLVNGGVISTDTYSQGKAGAVKVSAGHLIIDGRGNSNTGFFSRAGANSGGWTGSIYVNAGQLKVTDNGQISIQSDAKTTQDNFLNHPAINIKAGSIELSNHGSINASSQGNTAASAINIDTGQLTMQNAAITTEAAQADGGPITIHSNLTQMTDSRITTSAGGDGDGGDINLSGKTLILNGGFIQANAEGEGASGGNVGIQVDTLLASHSQLQVGGDEPFTFRPGFNVIQAASPNGVSGTITTTSPELNITGSMLDLKSDFLNKPDLDANPCAAGEGSTFVQAGYGGLPPDQDGEVYVPERFEGTGNKPNHEDSQAAAAQEHDASSCAQVNGR